MRVSLMRGFFVFIYNPLLVSVEKVSELSFVSVNCLFAVRDYVTKEGSYLAFGTAPYAFSCLIPAVTPTF